MNNEMFMSWTAEWCAASDCEIVERFGFLDKRAGLDEATCRVVKESGETVCISIQSVDHGTTAILEAHNPSEIIIVYNGRCLFGNVEQNRFIPLDRIGPFLELQFPPNRGHSVLVGMLGYCVARSAFDLVEIEHPYSHLIEVHNNGDVIEIVYEDYHQEKQVVTISQ